MSKRTKTNQPQPIPENTPRLTLTRETVRNLSAQELVLVAGGIGKSVTRANGGCDSR